MVQAALADAGIDAGSVDEIIVGNTSEGGNPARLISLAAGLKDVAAAYTIDRQCASGLDAILAAHRLIAAGDAAIVVAGGAESLSTAPWRVAKPRNLHQVPHFLRIEPGGTDASSDARSLEVSEALARQLGLSRARLDLAAMQSHLRAEAARAARRFVGEIVPLRANADEARDQSAEEPDLDDFEDLLPILPDGSLTTGNTSSLHDGAAFVVVVSEAEWRQRGSPPAIKLISSAALGVAPGSDGEAPIAAVRKLFDRLNGFDRSRIGVFEMSESSSAQEIALSALLEIDPARVNPHGGAVARGHPLGAAGAVLVVRLFSTLVRGGDAPSHGVATLGTIGGLGIAALFEAVR